MLIAIFCVWPLQISSALGIGTEITLVGYGPIAVATQILMLAVFLGVSPLVFRSPRIRGFIKTLYFPLGYPIVVLATNLGPAMLHDFLR
jgi:hypothetical protein